jgi:hypothetical protein
MSAKRVRVVGVFCKTMFTWGSKRSLPATPIGRLVSVANRGGHSGYLKISGRVNRVFLEIRVMGTGTRTLPQQMKTRHFRYPRNQVRVRGSPIYPTNTTGRRLAALCCLLLSIDLPPLATVQVLLILSSATGFVPTLSCTCGVIDLEWIGLRSLEEETRSKQQMHVIHSSFLQGRRGRYRANRE